MNGLSWMIYLAGVADVLGGAFSLFATLLGLGMAFGTFVLIGCAFDDSISAETKAKAAKFYRRGGVAFAIALIGSATIPSSNTIYAIAASEYGEKLATSETANKAVRALNAWLDRQIGETAEPAQQEGN